MAVWYVIDFLAIREMWLIGVCIAWLIFSGKKHEKFKEADELIAVIYDGAQHHLDADRYAVET